MNTPLMASTKTAPQETAARIDILTVVAIGICTYLLDSIIHEVLGHGLTALLLGLHPQRVTSVELIISYVGVPDWQRRIVNAAGCGAQLLVAFLVLGCMRLVPAVRDANTRYFLWLLSTTNLLIPGGYLMVLTLAGIGDWDNFVMGLPSPLLWKLGLTLLGGLISLLGLFLGARNLDQFAGRSMSGPETRRGRRVKLTFIPYLAGSAALTISAVFNPTDPSLILISGAAASFGGTAFLMLINSVAQKPVATTPENPLTPTRNWLWIGLGVVALLVYFVVLGPGLPR